jgi:hypothetical protein
MPTVTWWKVETHPGSVTKVADGMGCRYGFSSGLKLKPLRVTWSHEIDPRNAR